MTASEQKKNTYSNRIYIWLLILAAGLVAFDQLMKHAAVSALKDKPAIILIQGVLELRYLENQGAAFGILQNRQVVFTIITILFLALALFVIIKIPKNRYYLPALIAVTFLFAGAIGNFIDRTMNKYVVDFIYFSIIDFPIFNVADIYVTLSMTAIIIMLLFKYKDGDLDFFKKSRKETDEEDQT